MRTEITENRTWEEVLNWFEENGYCKEEVEKNYKEENGTMFYVKADGRQDADAYEIETVKEADGLFNIYSC